MLLIAEFSAAVIMRHKQYDRSICMKTPVNAESLRHHFTYSWWKYLLIVALVILLVDVVFAMTAYRVPPEKKIEFFVYGQMDQSGALEQYL